MSDVRTFGLSDAELASWPTVYRPDLFAGKTVLVSGGGSGLGKATAWLFGRLGAHVAICGRKADKLEAAAKGMREAGLKVEAIACNIRKAEEVAALFSTFAERAGPLDILVNNAGGQFPQSAIDFSPKGWNAVIETNLTGTWSMMPVCASMRRSSDPAAT